MDQKSLLDAIKNGDAGLLKILLDTGMQYDEKQLLVYAAKSGNREIINIVMDALNPLIDLNKKFQAPSPQPTEAPALIGPLVNEETKHLKPKGLIISYVTHDIPDKAPIFKEGASVTPIIKPSIVEVLEPDKKNQGEKPESFYNRTLSKLASVRGVEGDSERRTAVYRKVHEDSSIESTYKSPTEVEFRKRSNDAMFGFKLLSITAFIASSLYIAYRFYLRYPEEKRIYETKYGAEFLPKIQKIWTALLQKPLKSNVLNNALNQAKDLLENNLDNFPGGSKKYLELFIKSVDSTKSKPISNEAYNICKETLDACILNLYLSCPALLKEKDTKHFSGSLISLKAANALGEILPKYQEFTKENIPVLITLSTAINIITEHSLTMKTALYSGVTILGASVLDYFYGEDQE